MDSDQRALVVSPSSTLTVSPNVSMASTQTRLPTRKRQQSIRDAIHLLSSLLSEYGVPKAPLECFRQAKFNKSEAILYLWKLTFHVTQIVQFLGGTKGGLSVVQPLEPSSFLTITEKNLPTVQAFLRQHMFELGYRREEFFVMTRPAGSRELLLAFAWLLNRTSLFSMLTKHLLAIVKRTEMPLKTVHLHHVEQVLDENQRLEFDVEGVMSSFKQVEGKELSQDTCTKALHKLVWFRGCVSHKLESMCRAHLAYQKSAYKIYQSTSCHSTTTRRQGKTRDLSVHEVFLLRYPNQLKVYLRKLGMCLNILQKLVQWQECEPLFWQWMESVVDLQEEEKARKGKEDRCIKIIGDDNESLLAEWRTLQEEMESLLEKNRMERLNTMFEHKTRTLEHKTVNKEEQLIRKQLHFECPLVSQPEKSTLPVVTSMLEELTAIDKPVFVSVRTPVVHSSKIISTSAQLHQATDAEIHGSAHALMKGAVDDMKALIAAVEDRKSSIKKSLESLEQRLPATLCKLEQHSLRHCP